MRKVLGIRSWALAVLGLLAGAAPGAAEPSSSPDPFPVVDGSVSTILVDRTTAYIGGDFTQIAQPSGPMALVSKADGSIVRTLRGFASHFDQGPRQGVRVAAIEPDGAGGWYVGGEFARVDGRFRMSLVHLRADGTLDPAFSIDTDSSVGALKFDPQTNTLWRVDGMDAADDPDVATGLSAGVERKHGLGRLAISAARRQARTRVVVVRRPIRTG